MYGLGLIISCSYWTKILYDVTWTKCKEKFRNFRFPNFLRQFNLVKSPEINSFFSQALSGFLMMLTQNGKLLYISDNAAEYLGHSMVGRRKIILIENFAKKKI